jgi:hypothetical protein
VRLHETGIDHPRLDPQRRQMTLDRRGHVGADGVADLLLGVPVPESLGAAPIMDCGSRAGSDAGLRGTPEIRPMDRIIAITGCDDEDRAI